MIKYNGDINSLKEQVKALQSKTVQVTLNLGRNKFVKFYGTLEGVYPALFTVKPFDENFRGKTAYSYSEYMCGKVKLFEAENLN